MIEKYMSHLNELYAKTMRMDPIPAAELSTDNMPVIAAYIGKNPLSTQYGKIIGFISYGGNDYKFMFHVHRPHQIYANLSNKMTDIQLAVEKTFDDIKYIEYVTTSFGHIAFWNNTPLSYIKECNDMESYELRKLINKIVDYSRQNGLCKMFRKLDREALKHNSIYKEDQK